ncbi:MAG: mannitol dehydrogenase, partial [Clostridiaceae bacterium]|nr:mannitol dehydrogenase [Clostridiaceae bacterium]
IKVLDGVYYETSSALCKKYGFSNEEQKEFAKGSKMKLQDETITDYIERNARDPIRKLSCDDRLIGPARMAIEYDILPCNLCIAIAAAIYYENAEDESSNTLKKMREIQGVDTVLDRVCKIDINGILGKLIKCKIELLKLRGWINE